MPMRKRRRRPLGEYTRGATAEGDGPPRPEAVVNVAVTHLEYAALLRLRARLVRAKATRDRRRLRRGIVRILGRETVELIESGRRGGESVEVRLIPKLTGGCRRWRTNR